MRLILAVAMLTLVVGCGPVAGAPSSASAAASHSVASTTPPAAAPAVLPPDSPAASNIQAGSAGTESAAHPVGTAAQPVQGPQPSADALLPQQALAAAPTEEVPSGEGSVSACNLTSERCNEQNELTADPTVAPPQPPVDTSGDTSGESQLGPNHTVGSPESTTATHKPKKPPKPTAKPPNPPTQSGDG